MSFPSYVEPPTRAELARDEIPSGTRRLCEYCGCTPEDGEVRSCVEPGGTGRPPCHSFKDFPLCSSCGGEGGRVRFTPGSVMPDPQTEELCSRCEGYGVEGLI